ncbi:MAG: DUF1566 domain-containing protein [Treponema sp.]|jgi:TolB-like protein|nr:DUF1566 domain-containing protein [Treponema sp.]
MKKLVLAALLCGLACNAYAQGLPRLAVVAFTTNVSTDKTRVDAVTVRNLVENQMVSSGKYQVISREEIDALLENQRIQVSGISSKENIVKLQLQNISYIVTGSVDAMGGDYAVTVKILDVSSGQFSHSANEFMGGSSRDMFNGVNTLVSKFIAGMGSEAGRVVQSGTSGGKGYKIGDVGPGGGIVFLIEGNTCWEVSRLLGSYTWEEAVRAAKNYRGGGYSDWYLPSKEELNFIYMNLQKSGIQNLGSDWYWSSSQDGTILRGIQNFSSGNQGGTEKNKTYSVRAARSF